jgi:hypothetical protein
MEFYCERCGTHTHIVAPRAYDVRCWICGNVIRSHSRHDHVPILFLTQGRVAGWLTSTKEAYNKVEEKVAYFLAETYKNAEEFFLDEPSWSESQQKFMNDPNNSPPEARARFPRWR